MRRTSRLVGRDLSAAEPGDRHARPTAAVEGQAMASRARQSHLRRRLSAPVLVALIVVLRFFGARADAETIVVPIPDGMAVLHFDPKIVSEEYLGELALVSPYVSWTLSAPAWEEDEEDGFHGPDLFDVEIELGRLAQTLEDIDRLRVPPLLDAALAYVGREAAFYACVRGALLAYYRGDDHALAIACDEIDAPTVCSELVVEAPLTRAAQARHRLAGVGWRDCMNERFRERLGTYPLENWREFLRTFGVEEEIVEHRGC